MRRGTIFVIIFILLAAGIVGASLFLRSQPPLEITVAVNPLAESWVRAAVDAYNASEPVVNATRRVIYRVTAVDDLTVWSDEVSRQWTETDHPAALDSGDQRCRSIMPPACPSRSSSRRWRRPS